MSASSLRPSRALARTRGQGGFTLLEIAVVVAIIGILVSVAVLRLPRLGGGSQLDEQMRRITTLIDMASEEALMQGRDMGLRIDEDQYLFYVFDPDSLSWVGIENDSLFRNRTLPEGMRMELFLEGQEIEFEAIAGEDGEQVDTAQPQVLILSSGELTPFELVIESDSASYAYIVKGLPFGGTEVELEKRTF